MEFPFNLIDKEKKIISQFGQDGVISEIFRNIGTTNKFCVEFGHSRTDYEGSNTGVLRTYEGWNGLLMDGSNENPSINLRREFITTQNILELFEKYQVPLDTDFVSIDVDSCDLWLFQTIIQSKWRPRVVSVEYNCQFPIGDFSTIPDDPTFRWVDGYSYGASMSALNHVAEANDYVLVACVYPCDCFFIRKDILNGMSVPDISFFENKTNRPYHPECSPAGKAAFIDYLEYLNERKGPSPPTFTGPVDLA
jgi:hypothetical protein